MEEKYLTREELRESLGTERRITSLESSTKWTKSLGIAILGMLSAVIAVTVASIVLTLNLSGDVGELKADVAVMKTNQELLQDNQEMIFDRLGALEVNQELLQDNQELLQDNQDLILDALEISRIALNP